MFIEGGFVVGFDPGTRLTGYAVLNSAGAKPFVVEAGVWELAKLCVENASLGARLEVLAIEAQKLLQKYNPMAVGLEKAVVFKNAQSALKLAESRGVLRLVCYQTLEGADKRLLEISPTQIKKVASGWGRTQKKGIQSSIKKRFFKWEAEANENSQPDTYDAIAVAFSTWALMRRSYVLSTSK
jgi:crossover junction endodeoxyribonuclease RuvC